ANAVMEMAANNAEKWFILHHPRLGFGEGSLSLRTVLATELAQGGVYTPYPREVCPLGSQRASSASGVALGAVRRNLISPSPVALPARFLKKSAAVSTTPTFSATATAIHWFKDTPSSFASRWAAFLMESGSFNG